MIVRKDDISVNGNKDACKNHVFVLTWTYLRHKYKNIGLVSNVDFWLLFNHKIGWVINFFKGL